ncbi:anti-repressor SinI family protein [Paenibacillus aurantius]|uniref:Anti-repressor SinI family protein n=1 Tax=Paenibacillus aurantius TaxID=2918900 RepID=A0AA96LBW8_9BACL|nr:anti-repressor SinI family protein [Paenibacillus aurantius]WNQ10293.1 anti-repressor SinI family protein [Paenibacillus aurantius]
MNNQVSKQAALDPDWMDLMVLAKRAGFTPDEVRTFLQSANAPAEKRLHQDFRFQGTWQEDNRETEGNPFAGLNR